MRRTNNDNKLYFLTSTVQNMLTMDNMDYMDVPRLRAHTRTWFSNLVKLSSTSTSKHNYFNETSIIL